MKKDIFMIEKYKKAIKLFLGDYIFNQIEQDENFLLENKYITKEVSALFLDVNPFTNVEKQLTNDEISEIYNCHIDKIAQ
ncbi:MAG: hypothetical protein JEY91_20000, partial [Spirochaetaceae bacterium]|nr:hypothetical protein [Spirochaetaceae bacterium]